VIEVFMGRLSWTLVTYQLIGYGANSIK